MTEAVKVMVRCRPMSQKEKDRGCTDVVQIDSTINQVRILKTDAKEPPKTFSFDFVFGADSLQSLVYQQTAFSLVDNVLEGYNGTIFAYGQTGCGKTHTMMGTNQSQQSKGIIPRTFHQIITLTNSQKQKKHLVHCSFIQIYNQEIHDLLGRDIKARMDLKQSPDKGVFVKDLTMNIVKTQQEMQKFMDIGFKNRAVRETAMNKQSSRSHSIFTIHIQSEQIDQLGDQKFKAGKLNLVDLAGSERQSKTNATGDGMKEAAKINLSLSALGNVISALVDGKTHHIPYRDSKLTRLLQDSLGGNTKTIMIAAVSPADYNYDQTLSTLRYASRAKFIQNKPVINEDPKDTLLRQYAEQIKNLKMMLQGKAPMTQNMLKQMSSLGQGGIVYKQVFIQKGEANQSLKNQLKSKQDALRFEQQEKKRLKEQMQNLQKLISHEDTTVDKKQLQKMNKLKEKLKQQKKKEEQYLNQKKKKQVEMLTMQKSYKSLNEQVQAMRIKFAQIKAKYLQNQAELRDIKFEHQRQKQQLLDTIRGQQSEVSKYSSILKMLLTADQIEQIISQSEYDDQTKQWTIVPFYYRQKNVNFPKLGGNHTKQFIQNQKDKKQIVFRDSRQTYQKKTQKQIANYYMNNDNSIEVKPQFEKKSTKARESYRVSQVVKGARQLREPGRDKQKSQYSGKYNQGGVNTLSHNQLSPLNPNIKQPKSTNNKNHFLNVKSQSQQRIKLDEGSFNNLNKIKLNPIQTKKQMVLKQMEDQSYNQHFPYNGFT